MLQPFVRGDRARNLNEASGFGLGLSIVQAIVEAHHGRLILENRPEGGLCAMIELPLAAQGFFVEQGRRGRRSGGAGGVSAGRRALSAEVVHRFGDKKALSIKVLEHLW